MSCPECKGTGKITLFTSVVDCEACKDVGDWWDPRDWENVSTPGEYKVALGDLPDHFMCLCVLGPIVEVDLD